MEMSSETSASSEPLSEAVAGSPIFHSTPSRGPEIAGGISFPARFRNLVANPENLINPGSNKQTNRVAKKFRISKKYFEGKKLT